MKEIQNLHEKNKCGILKARSWENIEHTQYYGTILPGISVTTVIREPSQSAVVKHWDSSGLRVYFEKTRIQKNSTSCILNQCQDTWLMSTNKIITVGSSDKTWSARQHNYFNNNDKKQGLGIISKHCENFTKRIDISSIDWKV